MARIAAAVGICLVGALAGAPAKAWTDARAQNARVVLDVSPAGQAFVSMEISLRVRGGWLEGYEVSGLDPDARLDTVKAPVLTSDTGQKWTPRARMRRGGRLQLSFDRRSAPRRGTYRLWFGYHTALAHRAPSRTAEGSVRFRWTLPAWRTGLEEVEVWVWAPSPTLRPDVDVEHAEVVRSARASLLRYHRTHLPRLTPWTLTFGAAAADFDASVTEADAAAAPGRSAGMPPLRASARGARQWPLAILALLYLAFAVWTHGRASAVDPVRARRFWLGSPLRAAAVGAAGLLTAACLTGAGQLAALGCAALALLDHRSGGAPPLRLGLWRRLGRRDRRTLRLAAVRSWLGLGVPPDPLSLAGLAVPAAALAAYAHHTGSLATAAPWLGACVALAACLSPRRHGQPVWRQALRLFRLAELLRLQGMALSVRAFDLEADGLAQPRLSCVPAAPVAGLLRLEVAADSRAGARGFTVMATVAAGGSADRWLEALQGQRARGPGTRRACHLWAAGDVAEVSTRLGGVVEVCAERASRLVTESAAGEGAHDARQARLEAGVQLGAVQA